MDRLLLAPCCTGCAHSDNEWVTCDGRNCKTYQEWKKKAAAEAKAKSIAEIDAFLSSGEDNLAEKIYDNFWKRKS